MEKTLVGVVLNIFKVENDNLPKLMMNVMFQETTIKGIECGNEVFIEGNIVRYQSSSGEIKIADHLTEEEQLVVRNIYLQLDEKRNLLSENIKNRVINCRNLSAKKQKKEWPQIKSDEQRLAKQNLRLTNMAACFQEFHKTMV